MRAEKVYAIVLLSIVLTSILLGLAGIKTGIYLFTVAPLVALAISILVTRDKLLLILGSLIFIIVLVSGFEVFKTLVQQLIEKPLSNLASG